MIEERGERVIVFLLNLRQNGLSLAFETVLIERRRQHHIRQHIHQQIHLRGRRRCLKADHITRGDGIKIAPTCSNALSGARAPG